MRRAAPTNHSPTANATKATALTAGARDGDRRPRDPASARTRDTGDAPETTVNEEGAR
jgi:hypothetical protein